MNLRINLILPNEQRSASVVTLKGIGQIVLIVIPTIFLLIVGMNAFKLASLKNEVRRLEERWAEREPKKAAAQNLRAELQANRAIQKELNGWKDSNITVHRQLLGLMKLTPKDIQYASLRFNQSLSLQDDQIPIRVCTLSLGGLAIGKTSEEDLRFLLDGLKKEPPFASLVENADMRGRKSTEKDANKDDKVFTCDCTYRPRKLE